MKNELDPKQMRKLERAFFENLMYDEYQGIGLDSKRPFGNSDVEDDLLSIIGETKKGDDWSESQRVHARSVYRQLVPWLKARHARSL